MNKPQNYRDIIDELVDICKKCQGAIAANRAISGIWNFNASDVNQDKNNTVLNKLSIGDREILAKMLRDEVVCGIFETLKVLEKHRVEPFQNGYEDSPCNDFIGRNAIPTWEWPANNTEP